MSEEDEPASGTRRLSLRFPRRVADRAARRPHIRTPQRREGRAPRPSEAERQPRRGGARRACAEMAPAAAWRAVLPLWLLCGVACSSAASGDGNALPFDIEGSSAVGRPDPPETSEPRVAAPPAPQVQCPRRRRPPAPAAGPPPLPPLCRFPLPPLQSFTWARSEAWNGALRGSWVWRLRAGSGGFGIVCSDGRRACVLRARGGSGGLSPGTAARRDPALFVARHLLRVSCHTARLRLFAVWSREQRHRT